MGHAAGMTDSHGAPGFLMVDGGRKSNRCSWRAGPLAGERAGGKWFEGARHLRAMDKFSANPILINSSGISTEPGTQA